MKVSGYSQQVTSVSGSSGTPTLNLSASAKAAANSAPDLSPIIKGVGSVVDTMNYVRDQEDRKNILTAMDDYNKQMNDLLNGQNGLLNKQLGEAEGITDTYAEAEKKIRENTLGKTKLFFQGNRNGLEHSLNTSSQQGLQRVAQWQYKQSEAVSDLRTDNIINDNIGIAQANYNDENVVKNCRVNIANALSLRHAQKGAEYMEAIMRQQLGKLGTSLLDSAMANNDMGAASGIFSEYKQFMTPEQRNKFEQKAVNIQVGNQQRNLVDSMIKEGLSVEEALKRIDSMDGYTIKNINSNTIPEQAEGTTWDKKTGVSFEGMSNKAIRGRDVVSKVYHDLFGEKILWTSGMDGEHSSHSGNELDAADNYGSNILSSKENRDKLKTALASYGIKIFDEYENDSKYKTADHLHFSFSDFKESSSETKIPMNAKEKQDLKNLFISSYNQQKNIQKLQDKDSYNGIVDEAVEMAKQGVPLVDAMQKLVFDKTGKDFINAKSAVSSAYSGLKVGGSSSTGDEYGKGSNPLIVSAIKDSLYKFDSKADAIEYAKSKGLSQSDVNKIYVAYDQYLTGEGEFAYKWSNIKQRVLSKLPGLKGAAQEQAWAEARAAGADFIRDYQRANNGLIPGDGELIAKCQEGMLKNFEFSYKKTGSLVSTNFKYSKGAKDIAGIKEISESSAMPDQFYVEYKNNKAEYLPKEQVVEKLGGTYK